MKGLKAVLLAVLFLTPNIVGNSQSIDLPYEVGTWQGFRSAAVTYTFDDGCSNQFAVAIPMFDEYDFDSTLFTVTDWVTDWTDLQYAALGGHEVGSHTVTHPLLSRVDSVQARQELRDSKSRIETVLGESVQFFAYPYGAASDFNSQTIELVRHSGYKLALTTESGSVNRSADPLALKRCGVIDVSAHALAFRLCTIRSR